MDKLNLKGKMFVNESQETNKQLQKYVRRKN